MVTAAGHPPPHWTQRDIDVDGIRLHIHRTGRNEKPALVLLHGLSDNGLCWTRVARALESDFDVVMLDARNHGQSATAAATPEVLAADVAATIARLALEQPAIIGHSIGAHTAALLASTTAGVVSRLVLEDPPWTAGGAKSATTGADHSSRHAERRREVRAWLTSFQTMTDDDIAELGRTQHADWPDQEYPAWIESNRQVRVDAADGLAGAGWVEIVDRIDCPTLLLGGESGRGGIVTDVVAAQITRSNSNVIARFIGSAGHNIRRENFEHYLRAVTDFLHAD